MESNQFKKCMFIMKNLLLKHNEYQFRSMIVFLFDFSKLNIDCSRKPDHYVMPESTEENVHNKLLLLSFSCFSIQWRPMSHFNNKFQRYVCVNDERESSTFVLAIVLM